MAWVFVLRYGIPLVTGLITGGVVLYKRMQKQKESQMGYESYRGTNQSEGYRSQQDKSDGIYGLCELCKKPIKYNDFYECKNGCRMHSSCANEIRGQTKCPGCHKDDALV